MTTSTNFSFQFGKDIENFPPEIIFDPEDVAQCSPVAYFPTLIVADDQELLPNQIKLVNIKMKKLKMNLILEKKQLILIVVYVSVKDDDGQYL